MRFCSHCSVRKAREGNVMCEFCLERARRYHAERRERLPSAVCRRCGVAQAPAGFKRCDSCRAAGTERMAKWRRARPDYNATYLRTWNRRRRDMVIAHYGGKCACCGESRREFLAIDHVHGGGMKHRTEIGGGGGATMVEWIIKHNFPDRFRVLCHNCNQAIGYYGACPHARVFLDTDLPAIALMA
jgi:hypothetical protein